MPSLFNEHALFLMLGVTAICRRIPLLVCDYVYPTEPDLTEDTWSLLLHHHNSLLCDLVCPYFEVHFHYGSKIILVTTVWWGGCNVHVAKCVETACVCFLFCFEHCGF